MKIEEAKVLIDVGNAVLDGVEAEEKKAKKLEKQRLRLLRKEQR